MESTNCVGGVFSELLAPPASRHSAWLAALSLALSSAFAAEGPGVPNIAYAPSRTGEILSRVDPLRALSATVLHRGYLFTPLGADHGGGQGAGAFAFYDLSNPSAPRNIFDSRNDTNRYHTYGTLDYVGDWAEHHHISISGSIALISERRPSSAGFSFFDLAPLYDNDPQTHPRTISRYSFPGVTNPSNYDGYSFAPGWQGQRYVYAPTGANGLFVVDTRDLGNPVLLAHRSRSQLGNLTLRQAIPIGNLLILATTALESTLDAAFMDISDPANPVQINTLRGPQGYQAFVYGSALYGGGTPLQRHDFTNPANIVTTTMQATPNFDRPEYGYGQDGYLFIGHDPGATKWKLNGNSADPVGRVNSGINDNHAFLNPLGNLIALCSDHNNDRKLIIGIHGPDKDVTGPGPLYVSPVNGKTRAHLLSRVGISFSDTIDSRSLDTSTMILRQWGSTQAIAGTYSTMMGIVNFVPDAPLSADTTYEIVLTAGGVKDQSGNGVAAETVVSQFSTGNSILTYITKINSPVPAPVGTRVDLAITVSGGTNQQLEHAWDFGDGTAQTAFSAATSASHTYTTAGNHSVTVRTREIGGTPIITAVTATQVIHHPISATPPVASSTIIADPDQPLVWNVNPDNDSVTAIHTTDFRRVYEVPVGRNPRTLVCGPSNSLWVVNKEDATLSVIDRATGVVSATHQLPAGSAPHGIVIHSGFAYVSLEATGQVAKISASNGAVLASVAVGAWPRSLALDPGRQLLWVARFISPDGAGVVSRIDLTQFTPLAASTLAIVQEPDSGTNGRGLPNYLGALAISPDLTQLYIPAKKDNILRGGARDGLPLSFEHTVRSMAANVDLRTGLENSTRRIDFDNSDFATAVAFSPLGNLAFFTTSGSTTIWAVDAYRPSSSFTFSSGGLAPDGLAFDAAGSRLFIHNFMDRSVTVFNASYACGSVCGATPQLAKVSTVTQEKLIAEVLRGKQLFYDTTDPRLAQEGYMSCASCHLDGGHDGRVWDFTSLGEGLRNTIDLTGRGSAHGPAHWTANFDEIQDFEGQIRTLSSGAGLMSNARFHEETRAQPLGASKAGFSADLDALAAYVHSLQQAGRSPHRAPGDGLTPEAAAGKAIFQQENCAACHGGNSFADSASLVRHDVGTLRASSGLRLGQELDGLDTPTLRGLWKSAPYLHDGSAATVREVLEARDLSGRHVNLFHRTSAELDQLAAYILSIDDLETAAPTGDSSTAPLLVSPGQQETLQGSAVTLAVQASSSSQLAWQALALPPGLFIDPATGVIRGAPQSPGLYTAKVAARDRAGRSAGVSFYWSVNARTTEPNLKRYVKIVADSSLAGDSYTSIPDFQLFDGSGGWIQRSGWTATASTAETVVSNDGAPNAIDNSTATMWHSEWGNGAAPPRPHELVIDLGSRRVITGFSYLPRQDMTNGRIGMWRFFWSDDRVNWTLVAQGAFPAGSTRQNVAVSANGNGIPWEGWTGIAGTEVSALAADSRFPNVPTATEKRTSFEAPANFADNFGARMHGFLIPPASGNYTFWIASDANSELSLSANHRSANATVIARVNGNTAPREWSKSSSQQSTSIPLTVGVRYYIRALHKEGTGEDHLAVAWQGPGIPQSVIPDTALTPYTAFIDDHNQPPVFTAPIARLSIRENSPIGTLVGKCTAVDPDAGDAVSYQITGGNAGGVFSIDTATGDLRVAGVVDFESRSVHELQILATDNGNPSAAGSRLVWINVGNVIETNSEVVSMRIEGSFPGHGNPSLVGFNADPDGDGTPNALEVLFGTAPGAADSPPPIRFNTMEDGGKTYMVYEFDVAASIDPALSFDCVGGDLIGNWTSLSKTPELVSTGPGIRTYRVRDDIALQDAKRRFMRISVAVGDTVKEGGLR